MFDDNYSVPLCILNEPEQQIANSFPVTHQIFHRKIFYEQNKKQYFSRIFVPLSAAT